MRGRKPKPSILKMGHGDGKRRPPVKISVGVPDQPSFLDDEGRAEWVRVTAELTVLGVLSKVERAALSAYCRTWSLFVVLVKQSQEQSPIIAGPRGGSIKNPVHVLLRETEAELRKWLVEFGLTPSSRTRITAGSKGTEEADPLVRMMQERQQRA